MLCQKCGLIMEDGFDFCPDCGTKVEAVVNPGVSEFTETDETSGWKEEEIIVQNPKAEEEIIKPAPVANNGVKSGPREVRREPTKIKEMKKIVNPNITNPELLKRNSNSSNTKNNSYSESGSASSAAYEYQSSSKNSSKYSSKNSSEQNAPIYAPVETNNSSSTNNSKSSVILQVVLVLVSILSIVLIFAVNWLVSIPLAILLEIINLVVISNCKKKGNYPTALKVAKVFSIIGLCLAGVCLLISILALIFVGVGIAGLLALIF